MRPKKSFVSDALAAFDGEIGSIDIDAGRRRRTLLAAVHFRSKPENLPRHKP
jgi:hypothetical protein